MVKCLNCGKEIDSNAKFCSGCGNKLSNDIDNSKSEKNIKFEVGEGLAGYDDDKHTSAIISIHNTGLNLHWKGTFTGRDKGDQFIRYEDITSIGFKKGLVFGRIEVRFPGGKIKVDNIDKKLGQIFVSSVHERIANLKYSSDEYLENDDLIEKIKQAKELLDAGAITSEEFEAIKHKYLNNN